MTTNEESVFAEALEKQDPRERAAFLDKTCAGDTALRQRVDSLLAAYDAGAFLETNALGLFDATPVETCLPENLYDFLAPPQDPGEIGRLDSHRILRVLGAGGMGIVFEAEDAALHRKVALKVMRPELAAAASARQRFLGEARAAAALDNEYVVPIYQVVENRDVPFIVMPLLKGMNLDDRLKRGDQLRMDEVLSIGVQVARGLAAAHQRNLIHRDIKPANIWLERNDEPGTINDERNSIDSSFINHHSSLPRVKILDFGLARLAGKSQVTHKGTIIGTPSYMAPEQARGDPLDSRADLFSLGCLLYRLCTDRLPFPGNDYLTVLNSLAVENPLPPRQHNSNVPEGMSKLIMRLLAKPVAERPASAAAVIQELESLQRDLLSQAGPRMTELRPTASTSQSSGRAPPPPARRWLLTAAVVLAALTPLAWWLAPTVIRIVTNKGELIVEVDDPTVEIKIMHNGLEVQDKHGKRVFTLTPGKGEIDVVETDGVKLTTKKFELTRGGTTTVKVTLQDLAGVRSSKEPILPGDAEPDRRAAAWALSIGGTVQIKAKSNEREIRAVGDLPRGAFELTHVNLGNNPRVSDVGLTHFNDCKNLTKLDLSNTPVSDEGLVPFKDCHKLTFLDLAQTQVSDAGLAHFKNCRNLQTLGLYNAPNVGDDGLAYFKECENLVNLFLFRTQVTDTGLAHFKNCKNLMILSLPFTQVSDTGLAHFRDCLNLTQLDLNATKVTNTGLGHFKNCRKLELVGVNATQVGDAGLAHLKDCKDLRVLGLDRTQVSDEGLAHFKNCLKLADINLSYTRVSDKALAHFKNFKSLTTLNLGSTSVSDEGLTPIAGFTKLEWVILRDTSVTDVGVKKLSAALPKCRIEWDGGVLRPKPATPPDSPAETKAFVVLTGKGVEVRKWDTLAEAVKAASDGDIIEIRGNGPFLSENVDTHRTLTIRAGAGFRPVIRSKPELEGTFLRTQAPVVLEGLEFQYLRQEPPKAKAWHAIVYSYAPFYAANCRFVGKHIHNNVSCISRFCLLRNCENLAMTNANVIWGLSSSGSRAEITNCLLTHYVSLGFDAADAKEPVSLQLTANTCLANTWRTGFQVEKWQPILNGGGSKTILRAKVSDNIMDGAFSLEMYLDKGIPVSEVEAFLAKRFDWQAERNLFGASAPIVEVQAPGEPNRLIKNWKPFWGNAEPVTAENRVRYKGGDLRGRLAEPDKLVPDDFRLRPDSPGYRAGKDGKDLGADIDLVGPGPAYERWKKTPEYQQWLKDSKQGPKAVTAETKAFVVLTAKGVEIRKYETLAEAAQGVSDGDIIEIRGNGPFVIKPIHFVKQALTIRAGGGFRPVIKASPESVEDFALIISDASLILEGLEIQRMEPPQVGGHRVCILATSVHAANCRFLSNHLKGFLKIGSDCELLNCEILSPVGYPVTLEGDQPFLLFHNCVESAGELVCGGKFPKRLQLTQSTFVTEYAGAGTVEFRQDEKQIVRDGDQQGKHLRVVASGNVFDAKSVFMFHHWDQELLTRLASWKGEKNLYSLKDDFLFLSTDKKNLALAVPKNLAQWKKLWRSAEVDSVEGRARLKGGNILAKLRSNPEQITPDDFRLRSDSPGYKAGKDGKDLGADIDLVGPGPAYERWKKTPEYQRWLKDINQEPKPSQK